MIGSVHILNAGSNITRIIYFAFFSTDCVEPTTSAENDTPEKDPLDVKNVKTTQKKNLLKKMQSQFLNDEDEDDDDETDDEQVLKPYECGKCKSKFSTIGEKTKTYPYQTVIFSFTEKNEIGTYSLGIFSVK